MVKSSRVHLIGEPRVHDCSWCHGLECEYLAQVIIGGLSLIKIHKGRRPQT